MGGRAPQNVGWNGRAACAIVPPLPASRITARSRTFIISPHPRDPSSASLRCSPQPKGLHTTAFDLKAGGSGVVAFEKAEKTVAYEKTNGGAGVKVRG